MATKPKKAKHPRRKPAARKVAAPRKGVARCQPAQQPSARAAALTLLDPGGPLGAAGTPALVVAAGAVLGANQAGASLGEGLATGRAPALAKLVEAATAAAAPRREMLRVGRGADGNPLTLEMIALPLADGAVLLLGRDATLDHNLRGALVDSRQRYKDLVEISSDFAWETGGDGTFVFVSPQGALGWRADELVGHDPRDFLADLGGGDTGMALAFQAEQAVQGAELWLRRADGAAACLATTAAPLFDEDGTWRGARGVCRDVTDERQRDSALARAEARAQLLNYIVAAIRDDIVPQRMLDAAAAATARALSARGCTIFRARERARVVAGFQAAATFGQGFDEAVGIGLALRAAGSGRTAAPVPVDVAIPGGGRALAVATGYRRAVNGAICLWRREGDSPWSAEDRDLLADVAAQLGLAIEQIANTEELERLSSTDGLTALLNRRTFFRRVEGRLSERGPDGGPGALMYVDLDNFKLVNDVFGHQRGDEALMAVTGLLKAAAKPEDLVSRLGGDEFALWLDHCGAAEAPARAAALLDAGKVIAHFSGNPDRPVGLSIGMAVFEPASGETLEALIARADAAMYKVKRASKGSYAIAPAAGAGAT